jgi:TolA-binding protein
METKHTLSDVLKRLVVDIDNMNGFLFSLQNILESRSENVSVSQKSDDGSSYSITVPSFGYLKGKIEDINTKFDTLLSTNDDVIGIKSANGDVRKFELKKTSALIADLENIRNTEFTIPTEFKVKNNWFFESFLNPLLYVSLDISSILTDDIDQFSIKRIIVNAVNNDDAASFFDTNYKGRNDLLLEDLKLDLESNAIDYFEDDNIVDIDVAINRFKGSFDVLRILEEENTQNLTNTTVSVVRRRYKLNSLNYTDVLAGTQNSKILAEGDVLITANDSEYIVRSVNKTDTEVVLERIFGIDPIVIGASTLKLKPSPFRAPQLQINVGFNEREIIFIKPISKAKNLTVDDYSPGVALYTNDLTIPLNDESTATLEEYYLNFVSDFGMLLLSMAKERKTPAIIAVTPSAPLLDVSNFSVVQVDQHLQDDQNVQKLSSTLKEKTEVEKEIQELNKKIDEIKNKITTSAKTTQEAKRLTTQLKETQTSRDERTVTLSTLVTNATVQLSTTPQFITSRKYSIRGFWQIPEPILTKYGYQYIVQFEYRYRYLSQNGNQPSALQQQFIDVDGTKKSATFSPWTEKQSKSRSKELDATTGLYNWLDENLTDVDQVNINQLDIPIRKGELVEIQVRSLSEAGWPENPAKSAWSNSVQISFPEDILSTEEQTVTSQRAFADKVKIDFERSLISRGLDTHLANQFTTGERFFAHKAEDISSGFFTNEGNVIDLYEQIKSLKSSIDAIQQALSSEAGVIKVSIVDPEGNITTVSNGDTVQLFAGFYKDLIKDTTGGTIVYNEGKIITKQYTLAIENTSATPLELISLLFGGTNTIAAASDPVANPTNDYHVNRRYDLVSLSVNKNTTPGLGAFKQTPSAQSAQVASQFIYGRVKEYGLGEDLYNGALSTTATPNYTAIAANYQTSAPVATSYTGQIVNSVNVPYHWGHYLPFNPSYTGGGSYAVNSRVWDGNIISSTPSGGGRLSEFCIHKDHPYLKTITSFDPYTPLNSFAELFRPEFAGGATISATATQQYLPFTHALHFETSVEEDSNVFGTKYYKQASRVTPADPSGTLNANRGDNHYPIKLGFTPNDEYLVGKYTCGSYLYAYPLEYASISPEGNLDAVKKVKNGTENSINIPILFQFRCSDKLGYVGGFRASGTLNNIKYTKKAGFDIIIKDEVPFSFDLQVTAQYTKETSLDAPLVQGTGTITRF